MAAVRTYVYPAVSIDKTGLATAANQVLEIAQLTGIHADTTSIDGKTPALGQSNSAGSVPVVVASDQSPIPITFAGSVVADQGAPNTDANAWPIRITDGTNDALISAAGAQIVDGSAVTQPISASALPLPAGASTVAAQATGNASLASIDTKLTSPLAVTGPLTDTQLRATPVPVSGTISTGGLTDAELRASPVPVSGTVSTGGLTDAELRASAVVVDGSGVTQPVSAASLPLPTGAATSAAQTTGNASLASIDTKLTSPLTANIQASGSALVASGGALTVQITNTSVPVRGNGVAGTAVTGNTLLISGEDSGTQRNVKVDSTGAVVVTGSVATTSGTNTNASMVNGSLTATTASTEAAPANAVGFIIMMPSTNTDNVRWCQGATASTTTGTLYQPGRDSVFVPCIADISICATVSGTNAYEVQWILSV